MKKIKFLLGGLFCLLLISNTQAQNPVLIVPPFYLNVGIGPQSLPTTSIPKNASNMQLNADGSILFYIEGNTLYDSDGDLIGSLSSYYNANHPYNQVEMEFPRTSEISIVPDPSNCNRYYVLTSCQTGRGYDHMPNAAEPYVGVVDFGVQRPGNSSKMGAITSVDRLEDLPSIPQSGYSWLGTDISGGILFSATKLITNGTEKYRYVFVSDYTPTGFNGHNKKGIVRFKIDGNGITYDGFIPFVYQNCNGGQRAEMELVQLANGHYKIACPYLAYGSKNGKNINDAIYTAELDASGEVYNNQENTLYFYKSSNNQDQPYIHGLEFSADASKLYITHDISQHHPHPFEYYDYTNPNSSDPNGNGIYSLDLGALTGVTPADFQFSQIELATDGKLYLGTQGRLASLSNPNTPSTNNFSNSATTVSGYTANYGGDGLTTFNKLKLYTLPDQIDGMDYNNFSPTVYDATVYQAQTSGTWKPGVNNNPWGIVSNDAYIKDKIIIPTGKTVTIKDMTFHFAPNAKVIIKPGGKLIVNNATLTNSRPCNNEHFFWQGVEVWGTSNKSQYPSNNPTYQGMLVLQNGGTIENAQLGAQNWKPNDYNQIGGVIQSTNGVFRNNRRDLSFVTYQNTAHGNPSIKIDDNSSFLTTNFVSDDNFIEGLPRQEHVSMWEVHGIHFNGCHFANNKTGTKWNSDTPNIGIHSIDASFYVGISCSSIYYPCPPANVIKSTFDNLRTAIEADGAGSTGTVTVSQSKFTNNVNGVLINNIDNVSVDRNTMVVNDAGYNSTPTVPIQEIGIKISNSTGFTVEENDISSTFNPFFTNNNTSHGIIIENSGTPDNRVYKNNLTSLVVGTNSIGLNRYNNSYTHTGLQFLCNTYQSYKYAINIGNNSSDGIRLYQGTYNGNASIPAHNIFHGLNPSNQSWDINNGTDGSIVYYYNPNVSYTLPINANGFHYVTLAQTTATNACPSSYSTGGGGGPIFPPMSFFISQNDSLQTVYDNVRYNYLSLIDGGDTKQLKNEVDNTWPTEAWDLRATLLAKSPFLSQEVLLSTAKKGVLPNAMLLEVLLANPDATKGNGFIEELKTATNNTFPQYMIQYVKDNRDAKTTRTTMENEMSGLQTQIALNQNIVKHRKKMQDSTTTAERKVTVQMGNSLSDKIGRIDFYIEQKQWNNAQAVLDSIKNDKKNAKQLQLVDNFGKYIDFRSSLGNRNLAQLDSSEVGYLKTLAEKKGRVAGYAQNILCFFYHTCYRDTFPVTTSEGSNRTATTSDSTLNDVLYKMTISPNPATSNTTITWTIYDQLQNCQYKVQSLKDGSVVAQGSITENNGTATINVNNVSNGYYVVKIINNGKVKAEKKLVIE